MASRSALAASDSRTGWWGDHDDIPARRHRTGGRLDGQIVRFQFGLALRAGRPQESLPEHLAIIGAIARRDPAAAESAARAHLTSVIQALQQTAT